MKRFQEFFNKNILPAIEESRQFSIDVCKHGIHRVYQATLLEFQESGCYMVFDNSNCLYIGSSINVKRRFGSHFYRHPDGRFWSCGGNILYSGKKAPPNSYVVAILCKDYKMLERYLVLKFRPAFNKKLSGLKETRWKRK